jgi:hypothetical protein
VTGLLGGDGGGGGGCQFLGGYVYILPEEPLLPVLLPLFPGKTVLGPPRRHNLTRLSVASASFLGM